MTLSVLLHRPRAVWGLLVLLLASGPLLAEEGGGAPALELGAELAALFGLEGGPAGAGAGLGLRLPRLPYLPGLRLGLLRDQALSAWMLEAGIFWGGRGGLAAILSLQQPLGAPRLVLAGGEVLRLEGRRPLFRLGCEASLGSLRLGQADGSLLAGLDWGAWAVEAREEGPYLGYASEESLRLFASGFRARLGLRLLFPRGP